MFKSDLCRPQERRNITLQTPPHLSQHPNIVISIGRRRLKRCYHNVQFKHYGSQTGGPKNVTIVIVILANMLHSVVLLVNSAGQNVNVAHNAG